MRDFVSIGTDGRFRSSKMERLAEIVEDYDPNLELQWIPPEYRTKEDGPSYRIYDYSKNYTVFYFYESDDPAEILARIRFGDIRRHDVLKQLEEMEWAQKVMQYKEWMDEQDERVELTKMFMSNRNYFTMRDHRGDLVKYDEYRRKRKL